MEKLTNNTKLARMNAYIPFFHLQKMATNTITIAIEENGRKMRKPWRTQHVVSALKLLLGPPNPH